MSRISTEISTAEILDKFEADQICTIVLKFTSFAESDRCHTFFINCETQEGNGVVCYGRTTMKTDGVSKLRKNDVLKFRNVVACERGPRRNGVLHDFKIGGDSEVHLLADNGESRQMLPVKGILKQRFLRSNNLLKQAKSLSSLNMNESIHEMPNVVPNSSMFLKDYDISDICTVTLKIDTYEPKKDLNFIFINCFTSDNADVVIVAFLSCHTEYLIKNDVVRFVNVKRSKPRKHELELRFTEASRAYLCHRRGRNYEQPKELLNGRESGELNEGEKLKDGLDDLDDDSCKKTPQTSPQPLPNRHEVVKEQPQQPENVPQSENSTVTGMLMTDFENVKHYQTQNWVYRADMRLDDGSKIKLLIDTGFGKWPFYFLKTGHRVSVGGKKVKYYQQEARLVCKGDDFDFDDSAAKQVAS